MNGVGLGGKKEQVVSLKNYPKLLFAVCKEIRPRSTTTKETADF